MNTGHSTAWVTTIGSGHPLVNVYDSKYIAVSMHLHAQIACLLMTQHAEVANCQFYGCSKTNWFLRLWASCNCGISPLNDPVTLLPRKDETSYEEVCVRQKINTVSNL